MGGFSYRRKNYYYGASYMWKTKFYLFKIRFFFIKSLWIMWGYRVYIKLVDFFFHILYNRSMEIVSFIFGFACGAYGAYEFLTNAKSLCK